MALVGDLGSVDLAQVFQVLAQNQKDGVLEIFRGGEHRALRFRRGTVTLQFDRDLYEERAIELLTLLGRVSQEKLQLAVANRAGSDAALIEVLVQMRILAEDEVATLFRERMAEELYDFFAWNDAHFEFHEGKNHLEGIPGEIDDRLCFPSDALVMEAARRLDEWSRIRSIIPDDNEVFVPTVESLSPEDDLQGMVFVEVDGARSVEDIKRKLGRARFEVLKSLSRLVEMGALRPLAPDEYPARGQGALKAGNAREAANLFDRAVEFQVGLPGSLGSAGAAWEAAGERCHAVERFVAFGDELVERQRYEDALKAYRRGHELLPTHLTAWKKLVLLALDLEEIHSSGRGDIDPETTRAKPLAEVFFEIGQDGDAVEVLERLVSRHPKNLDAKRALVQALDGAGNSQRLCELLESVAADLMDRGDTVAAAASLQRALRLQPQRKDLSAKIRELYRKDERKRGRVKLLTGLVVTAILLSCIGLLVYSREERARADLSSIDIDAALSEGEFDRARMMLEEFCQAHPFTFSIRDAEAMLGRVDAAVAASQEKEARQKNEEWAARKKRQNEALSLAAKADSSARSGDLGEALAGLRKALAVAPPDWDQAATVRTNADELEAYLSNATKLSAQAKEQMRGKDYKGARETIRELVTKYPRAPEGSIAKFPVLVKSVPDGAEIQMDGTVLRDGEGKALRTPAMVDVAPSKKAKALVVRLDGFEPATVSVDPVNDSAVEALLGRAADEVLPLPLAASGHLAMGGKRTFLALVGGRVAAFGPGHESLWTNGYSAGGEIAFPPVIADDSIYIGTTDGVVACVGAADGGLRWKIEAGGSLSVPFVLAGSGLIVASGDGRVRILDPNTGERRSEWRAGSRPAGSMAMNGTHLFVGTSEGRVRILDINNPRGEEKGMAFGSPVAAVVLADDTLVVSGDDGRIVGFEIATGKLVWETPGGRIASPKPVLSRGRILVDREGRIVAMDPRSGAVLASAPDTLDPTPTGSLASGNGVVLAALRDGTAAALRESDLAVIWRWPGPAGGSLGIATSRKDVPLASVAASGDSGVAVVGKQFFRFDLKRIPITSGGQEAVQSRPSSQASPNADSKNR
jgi:outer membrane protein assembly factor BamB/tetratricopeptide (TPR) repeat protein